MNISRRCTILLTLSLAVAGFARAEDTAQFTADPLTLKELAELVGITKSGLRVHLPEARYARLVAEITIKGVTRKEFVALNSAVSEFTIACFTEIQPNSSEFRRIIFGIASDSGASNRKFINDFKGTETSDSSTELNNNSVTYSYKFRSVTTMPFQTAKEVGQVRIFLETSTTPYAPEGGNPFLKK